MTPGRLARQYSRQEARLRAHAAAMIWAGQGLNIDQLLASGIVKRDARPFMR